jgi:hypothetical protein
MVDDTHYHHGKLKKRQNKQLQSRVRVNNDIDNPMARPKQKFSREDRMPPNTATNI